MDEIGPFRWFMGNLAAGDRDLINDALDAIEKLIGPISALVRLDIETGCLEPFLANHNEKLKGIPDHVSVAETRYQLSRFINIVDKISNYEIALKRDVRRLQKFLAELRSVNDLMWQNEYIGMPLVLEYDFEFSSVDEICTEGIDSIQHGFEAGWVVRSFCADPKLISNNLQFFAEAVKQLLDNLPSSGGWPTKISAKRDLILGLARHYRDTACSGLFCVSPLPQKDCPALSEQT